MTANGWIQILFFFGAILAVTVPLGAYMYRVMEGEGHFLRRPLGWLERLVYRVSGVDGGEQSWSVYTIGMLAFSAFGLLVTYAIQRLQQVLPFNPQKLGPVEALSSFNTAASFTTNTNWQGYVGETTMSYFSQMAGLAWHNFISAAAGIAIAVALARGITRRGEGKGPGTIGNFWVDLTRATVYILLPISFVFALLFVSQGMIQNLAPYLEVADPGGRQADDRDGAGRLAGGDQAARDERRRLLQRQRLASLREPEPAHELPLDVPHLRDPGRPHLHASAGWRRTRSRAGRSSARWRSCSSPASPSPTGRRRSGNPILHAQGVAPGLGNMEGKEVRFGVANSALYATVTTDASCGAVNSWHDSFTPLGGLVPLFNIQLGELVFGGVGAGLYAMLIMAILSVFIAGLMVGRTPEYLGKKIETREVKLAMLYVLVFPLVILAFSAWSAVAPYALTSLNNAGPHGLSEILYAFTSAAGNNGSAFAGISANTPWFNVSLGLTMLIGRFLMIVPALAVAGILAGKKSVPPGPGTLPTNGPLFAALLVGVILIVGALTFFPALSLSPIVEHFLMQSGKVF